MIERIRAALDASGLDRASAAEKMPLYESVVAAFRETASAEPSMVSWIPGRLEVFGKHTDYAGGHTLVCALPRGFALAAAPRPGGTIRLLDAARRQSAELVPPYRPVSSGGWRHYAEVVAARLAANFPGAALGADIVFASDLPSASGMSSSSALVSGIVDAIASVGRLQERPEWRANIHDRVHEAGYFACFENGLPFRALAGDAGVGTHGGSEDHAAIVCGEPGHLSLWTFVPMTHRRRMPFPSQWRFVIASSGVAAQKTGGARASYNAVADRARTLRALIDVPGATSLASALSAPGAADRLRDTVRTATPADDRDGLERRLDHFLREDARVIAAARAIEEGDLARLGTLADASQSDAELLLGNQVPETIALQRLARDLGAGAASAFGAGFGGSVWALVDSEQAATFARAWLEAYRARFPERTAATTFVATPGVAMMDVISSQ